MMRWRCSSPSMPTRWVRTLCPHRRPPSSHKGPEQFGLQPTRMSKDDQHDQYRCLHPLPATVRRCAGPDAQRIARGDPRGRTALRGAGRGVLGDALPPPGPPAPRLAPWLARRCRRRGDTTPATSPEEEPTMQDDYRDLTQRLRAAGLLRRQPRAYLARLLVTGGLLAGGLLLLAAFRQPGVQLLAALALSLVTVQIAFLVHDAGHRQAFAHSWQHALAGILLGDLLLGISYGWWVRKHNAHHANPNHADLDPDI